MIQKLKEKSAHQKRTETKETKAYHHNKIISHESLRKKLIPLKSQVTNPKETNKKEFKKPLTSFTDENDNVKTFKSGDFPEGCNYGLRLGKIADNLYLTVIDLDTPNSFMWFYKILMKMGMNPVMVDTGGGNQGTHFYFLTDKHIPYSEYKKLEFKGEIRTGQKRYVVVPPSTVHSEYKVFDVKAECDTIDDFLAYLSEKIQFVESEKLLKLFNFLTDNHYKNLDNFAYKSAGKSKKLHPINRCCSYLGVDSLSKELIYSITMDSILWENVINLRYEEIYGRPFYLELNKNILCIFHQEKNPSAGLFKKENGEIFYKDFHIGSQKAFNVVEVFHAIQHNKEPRFLKGQDWTNALLELFDWIENEQIETGYLKAFDDWWNDFRDKLKLKKNAFSRYIMKTLDVVMNEFRERMRKGHNQAVLAKRYVAPKAGIPEGRDFTVNRSMNFLVFAGLLKKAKTRNFEYIDKKTGEKKQRKGYIYSIDFNCSPEQIMKAFDGLIKNGIADVRKFKKSSVSAYYGIEKALDVFRSNQDKDEIETNRKRKYKNKLRWCKNGDLPYMGIPQKGSDDNVLPGRGKKRSASGVNDTDKRGNSHNPDTERINESDNNQLSECNSDTRGAYDTTIQDKHRKRISGGETNESEELKRGYPKEHTGNHKSPPD
jgi:hypothetical protein